MLFSMLPVRAEEPPGQLQTYLKDNHITFDALAAQFVDLVSFHELGHVLTLNFDMRLPVCQSIVEPS